MEEPDRTGGGIIIPDTVKEKPQNGEVLAVGRGRIRKDGSVIPLQVKTGDRILFGKYTGTDIILHGEEYLIMREEEVLGMLLNGS
jgi:chaperonin GroES